MNKNELKTKYKELQEKKVAIILPVYNAADVLSECLDSLLSQTHQNIDIFAINDASTDDSLKILTEFQKKDSRVKIYTLKHNVGVSEARNTALQLIEKAKIYDYVSFCDSDDTTSSEMISELLFALTTNDADVSTCCYKSIPENHNTRNRSENSFSFGPEIFVEQIFSAGKWKNTPGGGGYVWLRLFDTKKIAGLRFKNERILSEDELFLLEVATKIEKIAYTSKQLYYYRYRENSLCRNKEYSRKLLRSRIVALPLSISISRYASIVNSYAILRKAKGNEDLFDKKLLNTITPLLLEACKLNLVPKRKVLVFFIRTLKNRICLTPTK